jgi:hypothetical protein
MGPLLAVGAVGALIYLVVFAWYGLSPKTTAVGYAPTQPVPYSHAVHVGQLGIDCRYCHSTVELGAMAALPAADTCMNCHKMIRTTSTALTPVRQSASGGASLAWVRVHKLPDYVYFNHSAHIRRGVGCVSCHGRVDKMETVRTAEPLSMGWCLACHRAPEAFLRAPDAVTKMDWVASPDPLTVGTQLLYENGIKPSTDCVTCHR